MAGRMNVRASTEVGPVRVSVAPSSRPAKPARAAKPAQRRTLATGLKLPRKPDLPPPVAPRGWYPDPEDAGRMRWWNGEKWTRRFAEPGAVPEPQARGGRDGGGRDGRGGGGRGGGGRGGKISARVADAPPAVRPVRAPRRRVKPRLLAQTTASLAAYPRRVGRSRRD